MPTRSALPDAENDGVQSGSEDEAPFLKKSARMPLSAVPDRDARVIDCVKRLKMTAEEILAFSSVWPWPFNAMQEVDDRIGKLKLRNRILRKRHQSKHEQFANQVMLKIFRDAHRNGIEIADVEREYSIPGARLRADRKFRLGKYLFFLECEISNRSDGWRPKMRKYLGYRKGNPPFRVLFVFDDKYALGRVWTSSKEIMADSPNLKLFLFGWARDNPLGQYDCCKNAVWATHKVAETRDWTMVPLIPQTFATLR